MRWKYFICFLLAALLLSGCSKHADPIHVSGTVTFRGKPVRGGVVVIHPEVAKGNQGERGYAVIKDGKFDTRLDNGKGASPGSVKVVVGAEENSNSEMEYKPLFPPYRFETEVSPTNATFDIKVPG
jgi:hypothetical protein